MLKKYKINFSYLISFKEKTKQVLIFYRVEMN